MKQETDFETQENSQLNQGKILTKLGIIALLIIVLLAPAMLLIKLVEERGNRAKEVALEIAEQWGQKQIIKGPLLEIPYYESVKTDNGKISKVKSLMFFAPQKLNFTSVLKPQIKHRSIYDMVAYDTEIDMKGNFDKLNFDKLKIAEENILFNEAKIIFGISDVNGINGEANMQFVSQNLIMESGRSDNRIIKEGLSSSLHIDANTCKQTQPFAMKLKLRGSEGIYFTPMAKNTQVQISGKWNAPSFEGRSPEFNLKDSFFNALWTVSGVNTNIPQEFLEFDKINLDKSAFGLNLIQPVNHYSKNMRAVKYAILIIVLTFVIYFFFELFQKKVAHLIQYLLVGFALCIFYTLLLSISEIIGFNKAYFVSSFATVSLLAWYTSQVFNSIKSGGIFALFLSLLYLFIFSLIQLEEKALLFGSIGLFVILALIMFLTRKMNWYAK